MPGLPQGSLLGTLLFIIYVNDLDVDTTSNLSKFTGDVTIGRTIKDLEIYRSLQGGLDKLYD